jgi:hypothetical protein
VTIEVATTVGDASKLATMLADRDGQGVDVEGHQNLGHRDNDHR